ncbi:DUF559 domain-containing protein [Microbacterium sp. zg.Y625]|uniref:endonuclease domain-containing protein n=1 Tax=Microbacterium jiangjiandongii TaxID=3049071 RepID=UPI00214C9782|nr:MULTISPECIES: DUF559 domain-containing protein [unclassified Microbacterium]MCR2792885.1 DUF559 domain-containing protein [Microbacterium sp. zg.Y625]WIM24008.1 DUF559 domain-containing protein [Microbacterium sp. zg-Y625]
MDVHAAVITRGGVARRATLRAAGFSAHHIAQAVRRGELVAVQRLWVAVPDADPYLVAAARDRVALTCVTQARRLGLWVLGETEAHVAAKPHAGEIRAVGARVHWAQPILPRHPDALIDPVENVLATVAACQPFEPALAVWESALRRGLVERGVLERLPLTMTARRLLEAANPFADSGLESFVPPRLRWLRVPIVPQAWIAGHRVDFLIGDRLVLQIDGAHHVGAQRRSDIAHDAELMLLGYHVIRVDYLQVVENWPWVQDLVQRAVAQGLHRVR